MICDFHLHSDVSDGTLAPALVVDEAADCGVDALALTDHDDVAGVAEAQERGRELGVEVLPGIELSTGEQNGDVQLHILGLGIDVENAALLALVERLRAARLSRAAGILERLHAVGISLDLEALRARRGNRALGRPHIAEALVACGVCQSVDAAFGRYLARGRTAYLPSAGTSPSSAIRHIHEAGGVACLAHPPLSVGVDGPGGLDAVVARLVRRGLDGVEVWHPGHRPSQRRRLRRIARRHGLLQTGGSDFHGAARPGIRPGRGRGNVRVGADEYEALQQAIGKRG